MSIQLAPDGDPILDQFSEDGFVDCTFRIAKRDSDEREHRLHVSASHLGETVGFDVVVRRGIHGGFDSESQVMADYIYREGIRFLRSGPESDRLMSVLATLYGEPKQSLTMIDSFAFTAFALHVGEVDMESQPIKLKLFGNDGDEPSDDYFECFFNLELSEGFVYWNEKDTDYRAPLMRALFT